MQFVYSLNLVGKKRYAWEPLLKDSLAKTTVWNKKTQDGREMLSTYYAFQLIKSAYKNDFATNDEIMKASKKRILPQKKLFDTFMTDELHKARCRAARVIKESNIKLEKKKSSAEKLEQEVEETDEENKNKEKESSDESEDEEQN